MTSNILCIETSTDICSVAVSQNGKLLALEEKSSTQNHAKEITIMISNCLLKAGLEKKQLAAIAISAGPGSYTGLRIGVNTAKGLCYALDIPLIAIDSLQILAAGIEDLDFEGFIMPMIDARRMEVYTATYDKNHQILEETSATILNEEFVKKYFNATIVLCGNGYSKALSLLEPLKIIESHKSASAKYMVKICYSYLREKKFVNYLNFSPYYFKAPNITSPKAYIP